MKQIFVIGLVMAAFSMPLSAQVKMIAHRGASFDAPENTKAAIMEAWRQNSDAAELDIWQSADGEVAVLHDRNLKRTTGFDANVDSVEYSLLKTLDAGSWKSERFKGEPIPRLSDILPTIPDGKHLVIEIKCDKRVVPALLSIIDKGNYREKVMFISFDWEATVATRQAFADVPVYWLSGNRNGLLAKMEEAAQVGLTGVDLHWSLVDKEVMDKAHELGLDVMVWTVDDPEAARKVIALGVKSITTNRPEWLRNQLQ